VTEPYRVSLGGSSSMKKQVPDCENAARYRTPVVVSLLTVVGLGLGVVPSTQLIELSTPCSSGMVASRYRPLGSRAEEVA